MLSTCAKIEIFQIFLLPCLPVGSRPHNCYSDSLSGVVNFSPDHLPQSVVFFTRSTFPECGFLAESSSSGAVGLSGEWLCVVVVGGGGCVYWVGLQWKW